jgi:hypothetical protein
MTTVSFCGQNTNSVVKIFEKLSFYFILKLSSI